MTGVYHCNVKTTNGIVRLVDFFGKFLFQISSRKSLILTVVLIVFSIQSRKMSKYIVHLIRLRIFGRPFMCCVICSIIKTFCLKNDSKSLPSALLTYTTQQNFDVQSITRLLVVTCLCETKEKTFSTAFLTVMSKNTISPTECNSGTIQKLLICS